MSQRVWSNNEASAHKGLYTDTNNQPTIVASNVPATQAKSYAIVTMINFFPINRQAILIDAIDNATMKDYILAAAKVTGSEAFASRISNDRICIYLDKTDYSTRLRN